MGESFLARYFLGNIRNKLLNFSLAHTLGTFANSYVYNA